MAYNSPYTGAQVDSVVNNATNGTSYTKSKTPLTGEVPPNNACVTYAYLTSLLPLQPNNGGVGAQGLKVHPVGYIFEWSNKREDGTIINGVPNLTTPQNVAQYFGYGTWESFGVGRVTIGQDVNDKNFDTIGERGGESTHTLTTTEMPSHAHNYSYANRSKFEESGSGTAHYQVSGYATYATTETGGSQPHNNLQPYVVIYRWIRVA